jgi:hypothetical protein
VPKSTTRCRNHPPIRFGRNGGMASNNGIVMVVGQTVALGRTHDHQAVTHRIHDALDEHPPRSADPTSFQAPPTSRPVDQSPPTPVDGVDGD